MTSYRCPHRAIGSIFWDASYPARNQGGPRASVEVCQRNTCRDEAQQKVQEITGHRGEYLPYPVKPKKARASKPKATAPYKRPSKAETAAVPWDVLGALLVTAPTEVEEWAEQQLGPAIVTQAIKTAPERFQELVA